MCIVKELVSMHSSMKTCCKKEENDNEWKRPEKKKIKGEDSELGIKANIDVGRKGN